MGPRAEGREEGVAWRAKMAKAVGEAASARGCRGWEEKRVCRGWEEGTEREKRVQRLGSGEARAAMAAMPTCMLVTSLSLSCFVMSVCQSPPQLSKCTHVTGFGPSSDHIAISTAPVSEAGTMPMW